VFNEDVGFPEVEQRENGTLQSYTIDCMGFDRDVCKNIPNEPLGEFQHVFCDLSETKEKGR
jgi:hypothetical protein